MEERVVLRLGLSLDFQDHLAPLGELDGVSDQVGDDLPKTGGVALQVFRRTRVNAVEQFQAFLMRPQRQRLHGLSQAVAQVEHDTVEAEFPSLDLRKI